MSDDIEELKRLCAEAEAKWLSARSAADDLDAEASAWHKKMLEIERQINPPAPPTPIQKMLNKLCAKMARELASGPDGNTKIAEEDMHDSDHPCGQRWCSVCQ